ncbi:MAG: DUF2341 domain-containing protein, partial [Candidatus Aenigmarchaeota archaeon]|nr:DUF2341 domain-containing protein [Candidatus Aenigmarchaeota archaeon]
MYSFNSRDIVVFLSIIIVLALFFVPVDVENNNLLKNEIVLSNIEVFDCSTGELVSLDSDSGEYPEKVDIRVGVTENHVFLEGVGLLDVDGIIGPKIIIDDDLKQKIEQDTNIVVNDLVWVETNGFVPENTGGKIILSSIGQKTFKCDGTVDNPDCFEIDSCSVSEKPCYEFDSGNTIVYVNHFSGAFNTLTWTTDADWDGGIYINTSSELGSLGLCWEWGAYCGWDYRKPINVSAISALTDYQVNISVTWDSDMQDNFEDMRFTYYNETSGTETQIPYWFESNTAQTNAIVWFKTNLISGYNTVYMYYGNATATSESNGTDTFVFFTSFEDGTLGDWVQYNPSYPATISTEWASDGIYSAKIVKPSAHTDCGINLVGVETGSIRIILDAKHSSGSNAGLYLRSPVGTQILTSVGEVTDWTITWDVATPYTVQLTSIQYTPAEPMTGYYDRIRGIYYTATPPTTSFGAEQIPPTTGQYTSNTTDTLETISRLKATWNAIDSWKYKKEINISNTGSALADYQVKMVIDKEIDMNSNYSDLRFTDNTANLLNYWIEENNTVNATVWVKANLSASTNTTIYMYYGNPSAISESSSIPVILNDDFGTTDLIDGTNAASLGYTWTAYNGDPWGVDNYYLTNVPTQGISYLEKDFGEVIPYKKLETQYVWGGTTTGVTATTQAWTGSSWENIGSITSFDAGVYTYTVPDNTSKIKIWKVESHDNGLVINYWKFLPFTAATEPTISFISSQMSGDLSVEFSADGINWLTVSNNTNYITGGGIGSGTNLQYRVNVAELNSSQSPKLHDITLEYETGFNSCGILSIENGIYLLENDVSSAGTCFTIAADNITLDCQSNMINYSQSEVGYGIDVDSGFDNVTIKNCNIVQGSETEDSYAVYLSSSWDSLLLNNTITTVGDSSYGIYFSNSKNNTVYNTELIVVDEIDIYVRGTGSYKNHIINSTFDEDEIYFESEDSGSIEVLWYFDVYVNDSLGNPIGDANVTVWQTDGTIEFSMLTDSFGNIETQVLMEFIQNNTDKYVIDYVMNITKAGYVSDSKIIILSNYQFINVALLVNNPPQITIDSPLNSLYNHQAIWFNISV